jgi:hypothetical protein
LETEAIRVIKVKLDYQVFKEIKVREGTVVNQEKKAFKENLDFQVFRVFRVTKEKKEKLVLKVIKATKVSVVIKEIRVKLVHQVIKVRGVIKVKKVSLEILVFQENQGRRV